MLRSLWRAEALDGTDEAPQRLEEQWRDCLEEFRGFIGATKPGMKALLLEVEKEQNTAVDKDWVSERSPMLAAEKEVLWRSLKALATRMGSQPGPN